jgi:hypothetical protein
VQKGRERFRGQARRRSPGRRRQAGRHGGGALKAYQDALLAGDIETAKSLTSKEQLARVQGADVDAIFRKRSEDQKRSPWTISPNPAAGTSRTTFGISFKDGNSDRGGLVHVVNEDGVWRVDDVERH